MGKNKGQSEIRRQGWLDRFVGRLLWIIIPKAPQAACALNLLSLSYVQLFPHNPLNLPLIQHYLLPLNAYALGVVLFDMLIKPGQLGKVWVKMEEKRV